jgi:hypothetical protein
VPVKYPTLSLLTLDRGSLNSLPSPPILAFKPKDRQEGLGHPPQVTCAVIIEAIAAPDLSGAFLGKEHVYTACEAIVWAAALGPACAARAAL